MSIILEDEGAAFSSAILHFRVHSHSFAVQLSRCSHRRFLLRLPISQDFAEDHGVGEVAVLKVYIGEELIVEGGEQWLDVRFVEARVLEDDDRAGDRAIGEVVEVDGRDIIPAALGKKAFGRSRAEGAFPGKFQVFSV
jgi:hypothetical protein